MKNKIQIALIVLTLGLYAGNVKANHELGKKIFSKACKTCHLDPTATLMKSPPLHDTKAWKQRFENAKAAIKKDPSFKTPMDYLVHSVKKGKGAMPPGGMCVDEKTADKKCTDEAYKAAIEYMSSGKDND